MGLKKVSMKKVIVGLTGAQIFSLQKSALLQFFSSKVLTGVLWTHNDSLVPKRALWSSLMSKNMGFH